MVLQEEFQLQHCMPILNKPIKTQLQQLGVTLSMTRTELSPAQIKQLLQNPPAAVDPIIWEQAKVDNPDSEKLIPVPMVGFKELLRRLKVQDQMTKQHQTRLDIISEDIGELQKNQTTTMAKIAQYKRKLMDLSHRTLQVVIWIFFFNIYKTIYMMEVLNMDFCNRKKNTKRK